MKSSGFTARNKVVVCAPRRPGFSKFFSFNGSFLTVGGSGAEDILATEDYYLKKKKGVYFLLCSYFYYFNFIVIKSYDIRERKQRVVKLKINN